MSFNASLVMVRGDHAADPQALLLPFGGESVDASQVLTDWNAALDAAAAYRLLPRDISRKLLMVARGWTIVFDPEATMWTDTSACEKLGTACAAPVFAMACNGVVGSQAWRHFDGPRQRRVWVDAESGVLEAVGEPLTEEQGLSLKRLSHEDVLAVMERLGVPYADLAKTGRYVVCDVRYPAAAAVATVASVAVKPWWKFWGS